MKKNKKIIIFTGYFIPHLGGVERYVDKLSFALSQLGYEIIIVTSNESNLKNFEIKDYYRIYRLPIRNIFKNRYPILKKNKEFKNIVDGIIKEKADYYIVNTRFHLTSLVGAKLGKKQNKPVFLIEHGTGHFSVNNTILDFFGRIYEHFLTNIIKKYISKYYGVSKKCNDWLKHFNIKASGVFYNSFDINFRSKNFRFRENDDIIISYAGRLMKEKGVLNLLEAYKKLLKKYKNIKLLIAGDGPLSNFIKEKYKHKNIKLLGKISFDQVMSLYKDSDIFVYPSLYPEGLPTSILEAGFMKCAVVATPKGGTEEVIINDDYGIIIEENIESLYKALVFLINNKKIRNKIGTNLKNRIIKVFNWKKTAQEVVKEIKKMEMSK